MKTIIMVSTARPCHPAWCLYIYIFIYISSLNAFMLRSPNYMDILNFSVVMESCIDSLNDDNDQYYIFIKNIFIEFSEKKILKKAKRLENSQLLRKI